jgi:hypothetical protein
LIDDKPIEVTLNRNLGSPRAPGEAVEADLTRLIKSRSTREIDPDERGELWKASVRAYTVRRQEEDRLAWCDYFSRLAARVRSPRAEEYDYKAQALLEDRGEGVR